MQTKAFREIVVALIQHDEVLLSFSCSLHDFHLEVKQKFKLITFFFNCLVKTDDLIEIVVL